MIAGALAWLSKPIVKAVGITVAFALVVGLVAWYIRDVREDGKKAGAAGVTNAVQSKTIETQERSRVEREKTDADVLAVPYRDRLDELFDRKPADR